MGSVTEVNLALKAIPSPTVSETEFVKARSDQGVQAECIVDEVLNQRKQAALVDELVVMLGKRNFLGFLSGPDYVAAVNKVKGGISVQAVVAEIEAGVEASKQTLASNRSGLSGGPG